MRTIKVNGNIIPELIQRQLELLKHPACRILEYESNETVNGGVLKVKYELRAIPKGVSNA